MADLRYLVRRADGATYGPYPAQALREFAAKGTISPRDFVRPEHGTRWELARRAGCLAGAAWPGEDAGDADAETGASQMAPASARTDREERVQPGAQPDSDAPDPPEEDASARCEDARAVPATPSGAVTGAGSPGAPGLSQDTADADAQSLLELHDRLRRARIPITLSPDEVVLVLRTQSFLDVAARSVVAALLGRKGTLLATSQRIAATLPGLLGEDSVVIDLERISSIRIGRRIGLRRALVGTMLLLNGILAWAVAPLLGMAGSALSAVDMGSGYGAGLSSGSNAMQLLGAALALMGALALLASLRRSVCIDAGSTRLAFPCGRAGTRDIAAISDSMRQQRGPWRG